MLLRLFDKFQYDHKTGFSKMSDIDLYYCRNAIVVFFAELQ